MRKVSRAAAGADPLVQSISTARFLKNPSEALSTVRQGITLRIVDGGSVKAVISYPPADNELDTKEHEGAS